MKSPSLSSFRTLAAIAFTPLFALPALAAISEADLARLGQDLTPLGAERAGNAAGTIPAWEGGITAPPAGYKPGDHHPDPFPGDQPLATITASNLSEYADRLTPGHVALLTAYPSYKIVLYPTRRTASFPERIYEATKKYAPTARLTESGNGVEGALIGIPFPVPQNGLEAIWNHLLRYRGDAAVRHVGQAAPQRNGSYTLVQFRDEFLFNYSRPDITTETLETSSSTTSRPRSRPLVWRVRSSSSRRRSTR